MDSSLSANIKYFFLALILIQFFQFVLSYFYFFTTIIGLSVHNYLIHTYLQRKLNKYLYKITTNILLHINLNHQLTYYTIHTVYFFKTKCKLFVLYDINLMEIFSQGKLSNLSNNTSIPTNNLFTPYLKHTTIYSTNYRLLNQNSKVLLCDHNIILRFPKLATNRLISKIP